MKRIRVFPATYYARIRQYRQGPPPSIEREDYGHSNVQGFSDGVTTRDIPGTTTRKTAEVQVPAVPADFPGKQRQLGRYQTERIA